MLILALSTCSEQAWIGQNWIDGPQLLLNTYLSLATGGLFTAFSFTFTSQLSLFYLGQPKHRTQSFVIDNLPLVDAGELIECLTLKRPMSVVEGEGAIRVTEPDDVSLWGILPVVRIAG